MALQPGQSNADSEGVIVEEVMPGSPAAQAQLQPGDVIHKFDGRDVKNIYALRSVLAQAELNKNVELEIVRAGKPLKVTTQIKEQPVDYETSGFCLDEASRSRKPRRSRTIKAQSAALSRQFTWAS